MVPYLLSSATFEKGLIAFCVIKKLNALEKGTLPQQPSNCYERMELIPWEGELG